jgi:fumarate reductase subunit C
MRFYVRHWYSLNMILAAAISIALAVGWDTISVVQRLVVLNLLALFVHQFEEYAFPGGEPAIMNIVLNGSDIPDRFPLNQLSACVTNVVSGILLYGLIPFAFPQAIWLSIGSMLFNIGQLIIHGVITNRKMGTAYNPGLFAVVFLHLPLTVYFVWYVAANGLATPFDWVAGLVWAMFCAAFFLGFTTYVLMASRKTTWPFASEEMERFGVREKVAARLRQSNGTVSGGNGEMNEKRPFGPQAVMGRMQRKVHRE